MILDFRTLGVVNIGCEVEQNVVLAGARRVKQILNHGESTAVVLNHSGQKKVVESGPVLSPQAAICCGVNMPGIMGGMFIERVMSCPMGPSCHRPQPCRPCGISMVGLAAIHQPLLHVFHFVALRNADALSQFASRSLLRVRVCHQSGHLYGLRMMHDHALHEADVGLGMATAEVRVPAPAGVMNLAALARAPPAARSERYLRRDFFGV
jgi:hypothetical protein